MEKILELITIGWEKYRDKVANNLLIPENEKMMQLHLSQIYQTLSSVYESENNESIKVLLEYPVDIRDNVHRIIDIVISHSIDGKTSYYPIELKCFRLYTRKGDGKKRGAQNLGMYDYWEDIENIEGYSELESFKTGYQFTITDDSYYVTAQHKGKQVSVYSTYCEREGVTGIMKAPISNRVGKIGLNETYSMKKWNQINDFWFIEQNSN